MLHQRQLIREAAKAALVGKTAAGDRVFETRAIPFKRLELPAISIYALEEAVDPTSKSTAPRELKRTLQLAIEALVEQGDNVDDAIDSISLEIERAIHADETLGGTASDCILSSTDTDIIEEGSRLVGVASLTFAVDYYTYAPEAAPDEELADFARADIRYDPGRSVHEDAQAHDRLDSLHL